MKRVFRVEKETKNTIRFQEIETGDNLMIGPVYIQKAALDEIGFNPLEHNIEIEVKIKE